MQKNEKGSVGQWLSGAATVLFIAIGVFLFLHAQDIRDWWRLRGYTPPGEIAALADTTDMTAYARQLLYVNRPQLLQGAAFRRHCPLATEKTVVLGCYKGGDNGIFLYAVADERLRGVVEVTAVHEMLHAGYDRLSDRERTSVDTALQTYASRTLSDQRIVAVLEAYKQAKPNQLSNEMHSIFASEISALPPDLERYYARYFTNRQAVVAYTNAYQSEFTTRRAQVARYDDELAQRKSALNATQARLTQDRKELERRVEQLTALRERDTAAYNASVDPYNQAATAYEQAAAAYNAAIDEYNQLVATRNSIALEERELADALSGQSAPAL